jgi:GNAT superfamily N-acetyltransferase
MRIRRAETADAAALAAVHVAGWEGAYRRMLPDEELDRRTVERRTTMWQELLGGTGHPLELRRVWAVIAEREGRTLGFVSLGVPEAQTVEITALYVEPTAWRGGVGSALMEAALAEAARRGCTLVALWVLEPNLRARAFYAHCGFTDDGGRRTAGDGWPVELRLRREL